MKVLLIEPMGHPKEINIQPTLEEYYKVLDCDCITATYPWPEPVALVTDDNGLFTDMFKQDMSINCDDLGKLCRAAEDKRYTLRNNAETLQLKDILFQRTRAEMDAYHDMSHKPESWTAEDIERQRIRFCAVWQVIEEAELVDEYEAWKEANPNA